MTQNQIAYQRLMEDRRHNREDESINRQRNRNSLISSGINAAASIVSSATKAGIGLLRG